MGYGYLWWVALGDVHFTVPVGAGAYSARGNAGQFIVVIPKIDIVVVNMSDKNPDFDSSEMGQILKSILAAKSSA